MILEKKFHRELIDVHRWKFAFSLYSFKYFYFGQILSVIRKPQLNKFNEIFCLQSCYCFYQSSFFYSTLHMNSHNKSVILFPEGKSIEIQATNQPVKEWKIILCMIYSRKRKGFWLLPLQNFNEHIAQNILSSVFYGTYVMAVHILSVYSVTTQLFVQLPERTSVKNTWECIFRTLMIVRFKSP